MLEWKMAMNAIVIILTKCMDNCLILIAILSVPADLELVED
jgi:hypothetical protein